MILKLTDIAALLFVGLLLGPLGCAEAVNDLQGSVGDQYSLDFDQVIAERVMDQLIIRYVKRVAAQGEAARITIPEARIQLDQDLQMQPDIRVEHFYVRHDANNQLVQEDDFPALQVGALHLAEAGEQLGDSVQGTFSCRFVNGRTLKGYFLTALAEPGS